MALPEGANLENEIRREELIEWFRTTAPSLASAYEGAIQILNTPDFPGRIHFIGHAVRDITNLLPQVLDQGHRTSRVQYEDSLDRILPLWPSIELTDDEAKKAPSPSRELPWNVVKLIDQLLDDHRQRRERIANHELALRHLLLRQPFAGDVGPRSAALLAETSQWFMERTHLRTTAIPVDEADLKANFLRFEQILHAFVGKFFTVKQSLDRYIAKANVTQLSEDDHQALEAIISSPEYESYFFTRLTESHILKELQRRGHFDTPPVGKADSSKRPPTEIRWAALGYLARAAVKAPDQVAGILAKIPVRSLYHQIDLMIAISALPEPFAAPLTGRIVKEIPSRSTYIDSKIPEDLATRLFDAGKRRAAIDLTDWLLSPKEHLKDDAIRSPVPHRYPEDFHSLVPRWIEANAPHFLQIACGWLRLTVESRRKTYRLDSPESDDGSWIWRPAIEDHEQNRDYDFASVFVGLIRSEIDFAIREGCLNLDEVLDEFGKVSLPLMSRLAMHLATEFACTASPDAPRKFIMSRDHLLNRFVRYEYARLVSQQFHLLSSEQQTQWLAWVDAGPDESQIGSEYAHRWRRDRLNWVRSHLTDARQSELNELIARLGRPVEHEFVIYVDRGDRPQAAALSPADSIKDLPAELAFAALTKMATAVDPYGNAEVDLMNALALVVDSDPAGASYHCALLSESGPVFLGSLFDAFIRGIGGKKDFDLVKVLSLAAWTVAQPVPTLEDGRLPSDELMAWTSARDAAGRLVSAVCQAATDQGTPRYSGSEFRMALWAVLEPLTRGRVRLDSKLEEDFDPRLRDFVNYGMDSERGKAIKTVLEYAQWCKHQSPVSSSARSSMSELPEVRQALEWQLNPDNSSLEAAAIIGMNTGLIYQLDREWLSENCHRLFHLEDVPASSDRALGWAAWNAFVIWNHPHIEYFTLLQKQFVRAVDEACTLVVANEEQFDERPIHSLGDHLLMLLARGDVTLDSHNGVCRKFFVRAPVDARVHALEKIGTILGNADDSQVSTAFRERLMAFWDWIWPIIVPTLTPEANPQAMFSSWFISGKFPIRWSLERLKDFVTEVSDAAPESLILQTLQQCSGKELALALEIVDLLIRSDLDGYHALIGRESIRTVLASAMRGDPAVRKTAESLIDHLGHRGFHDFGDLLP